MKKMLLLLLVLTILPLAVARAEAADPFSPMTFETGAESAPAEHPLVLSGLDFGNGASILRFKAVTESELTIRVYLDGMDGQPIATAFFRPIVKENRRNVQLGGVHDLYITLEGGGTLTYLQAFTGTEAVEAAVRAEQGGHFEDAIPARYTRNCSHSGTVETITTAWPCTKKPPTSTCRTATTHRIPTTC